MEKTKSKSSNSTNGKASSSNKNNGNVGISKSAKRVSPSDQSTLMEEFFVDSLKDIYWAEKHLLKALPRLEKAATTQELKDSFVQHLEVTRGQITRLEQAFEIMGKKAQAKKCDAMDGLTKEAEGIIEDTEAGSMTRDVALIMAAQKVEHYEIASYGGLKQLAKTLGKTDLSDLMDQTLQEEKMADEMLTSIAENKINLEAASE